MEIDEALQRLRGRLEHEKIMCSIAVPNLITAFQRENIDLLQTAVDSLAELSRLRAEVVTLRQERDRLIERWPDNIERVVYDSPVRVGEYYIDGAFLKFPSRESAVRNAAGLPERGSDG